MEHGLREEEQGELSFNGNRASCRMMKTSGHRRADGSISIWIYLGPVHRILQNGYHSYIAYILPH
jgi:hypothetical protein